MDGRRGQATELSLRLVVSVSAGVAEWWLPA
jgi:hypothetical protein